MAVNGGRRSVSRPASMAHRSLVNEGLSHVNFRLCDHLSQASDFADLLEEYDFASLVAVNTYASTVVSTIL